MTAKEIIEKICKDNGLTLRQLAKLAGIKEQSLYDIKSDRVKKVSEYNALKISTIFPQYPPMWLKTGNDAFLTHMGATTNVNVDMGDDIHHNTAPVATRGGRVVSSDMEKRIAELEVENKALKEQVSDLTKSILNLTKNN